MARPALAIALVCVVTIASVWALQHAGYAPCELCLRERIPFYWGLPLALLVAAITARGRAGLLPAGYVALGLVFLAGAGLGIYHAGVEWGIWPGPSSCTGGLDHPAAVEDFLKQLKTTQVVRCDAPALQMAGLSLAAWNAVLCLALTAVAGFGFLRSDRQRG
ncbi:disulfide bond formation protein B [Lichenihabitans sp. Uapishka_5]|uniref:disulfide bond formation protein B n=1 Tax=Lichenihabitans sp. Uapishka_5 TaxID=3037302 RepID=UPI0029E81C84|nr:disulfide bond formation protein B [Lichenihabitans sp. Uapishka_5]MDX7949999.1 disulfide bond formation protein B [Lichenihabitans sp. Uapishka_5]